MSNRTSARESAENVRKAFLDRWVQIAEGQGGQRVELGQSCPDSMTMWSVTLQGPLRESMNLGHWAFANRGAADAAVAAMDQSDRSRNTRLSKPGSS